jgi:hypothetical protein
VVHEKKDAELFAEFLKTLTPEQVKESNEKQRQNAENEAAEFRDAFAAGKCSVCGQALASYEKDKPCLHWLLRPEGFEKNDLPRIAKIWGMGQMQLFLRRVANEEGFAKNINDLAVEGHGKLVELTIKAKDKEWSFSCGQSDYAGHESNSEDSRRPHYHFQMRVNQRPFINYNDYHLPLSTFDMGVIEAKRAGAATPRYAGGEGLSEVFTEENMERLATSGTPAQNEGDGLAKLDQIVFATNSAGMRGEDIMAAIQKAKAAGKPMTEFLREIPEAKVTTIVSPGSGTVEQALRNGGRNKRGR